MRYWDASAIVPLLVQEPRTADARAVLTADSMIVTWWGTRIESTSAIAGLERAAAVTPRQASQAIEVLRSLTGGWHEILPTEAVRETACRLVRGLFVPESPITALRKTKVLTQPLAACPLRPAASRSNG